MGKTYTVSSGNCPSFACATSSSLLMLTAGPVYSMASQQEKAFYVLLLRRHVVNWSRGPAVSIKSELLVAHAKLGQLPLLAVYVLPV